MTDTTNEVLSQDILTRSMTLACGRSREDKNFFNRDATVAQWLEYLMQFEVGPKDGNCILQGSLAEGGRRVAANMATNYIMLVDLDTGEDIPAVKAKVKGLGLAAVWWTTHSHMKSETEVAQAALAAWCKKQGRALPYDDADLLAVALGYLLDEKRYHAPILEGATFGGIRQTQSGVMYVINHGPMPKLRVMFFLKEPFKFATATSTQKDRIDLWKKAYEAVCEKLGVAWDRSCVDPSRLQYTPRVAEKDLDTADGGIIAGDFLDLELFGVTEPVRNAFTQAADNAGAGTRAPVNDGAHDPSRLMTPGLLGFLKDYPDFDPVEWLQSLAPEDERPGKPQAGGVHWTCPNEDSHTKINPDGTEFAVFLGETWGMHCRHEGCIAASNNDRLWYLDRLCQKYGVTDVSDLKPFSSIARDQAASSVQAQTLAADTATLDQRIQNATPQTPSPELEIIFKAIAQLPQIDRDRKTIELSRRIRVPTGKLEKMIKATVAQAASAQNNGAGPPPAHPVPQDLKTAPCVWLDWPWDVQVAATIARLEMKNEHDPKLFRRKEGGIVRVENDVEGRIRVTPVRANEWLAILTKHVTYKQVNMVGAEEIVAPPRTILNALSGSDDISFPELRSVSRVALFNRDGQLRTQRGYDDGLKVYLDPIYEPLPVPETPTQEQVDIAVSWLFEAIRDFPFSDLFDGSEQAAIKSDDKDDDGFLLPNLERGRSSRANAIAMLLQPFARNLIDGPTPSYHIDKASPGTGAGYLADVAYIVAEGRPATIQTMSNANEEFRKAITATLREGSSIIFIDNINRHVDSGDLAAALTSGVWRDRILGQSETVTIPITSMWLMAGNNLTFSHELMRRNVPIRMDAATPNPAHDRGRNEFKHFPLQPWLLANRSMLVWACHVLIANWIAKGRPEGNAFVHSFDQWSMVMAGILEAAGIEGFLDNVTNYLEMKDDEQAGNGSVAQLIASERGTEEFTTSEAVLALRDKMSQQWLVELPIQGNTEAAQLASFGKWFKKNMVGATFDLDPSKTYPTGHRFVLHKGRTGEYYRCKVEVRKFNNANKYRLSAVKR
jgi:hypothetical protein